MSEAKEVKRQRAALRNEFGSLYDAVSVILFEDDPAGINFDFNTDEYEPEVDTILPRLRECHTVSDVQRVVHEEFMRWFDGETAGPVERYRSIALSIWSELERRRRS